MGRYQEIKTGYVLLLNLVLKSRILLVNAIWKARRACAFYLVPCARRIRKAGWQSCRRNDNASMGEQMRDMTCPKQMSKDSCKKNTRRIAKQEDLHRRTVGCHCRVSCGRRMYASLDQPLLPRISDAFGR